MQVQSARISLCVAILALAVVVPAAAQASGSESLDEVNKELSNPISSIWALQLQENTYWLNKPDRNVVNLQFQPVLPLALTDDWNLITRPVFQVMNSNPYVNNAGNLHRVTGFGDTILATMLSPSPKLAGPWLLGLGPTFIFPTASNSRLGQNKWQFGPAGVFGYLGGKWLAGVFPQQWFSVGGPGSQTVSQMNIQHFFVYLPGDGWGIGTSPNILVNWYANKSSNMLTFPVGLNVSKVIKIGPLPVKLQVQGQYMPIHPDQFGQKWDLQFSITPVIPKLIKGNLLGD
jgi:hypothetical protein